MNEWEPHPHLQAAHRHDCTAHSSPSHYHHACAPGRSPVGQTHPLSKHPQRPERFFPQCTYHSHDGRERFYWGHLPLFLHTRPESHLLSASRSGDKLPIEKGQFLPGWDKQQHQSYPHYTVLPDKSRALRSSLYAHTTHLY